MPVRLPMTSYDWALKHLRLEGDSDLFPPLFEVDALQHGWRVAPANLRAQLRTYDLDTHEWRGGQRFVVPKDQTSFRIATRLDPIDALVFTAFIRRQADRIESSRIPTADRRVCAYRFSPTDDGRLYGTTNAWRDFWQTSVEKARNCRAVAVTDISDYYNQIYHHTLENQLREARLDEPSVRVVKRFLASTLQTESRGIPVGPHSTHLLAECAMNSTDRSLVAKGYDFCRYVDDFHFFCESRQQAQIVLFDFAEILDRQQRLVMSKVKTRILDTGDFLKYAGQMLIDRPMNAGEDRLLTP